MYKTHVDKTETLNMVTNNSTMKVKQMTEGKREKQGGRAEGR